MTIYRGTPTFMSYSLKNMTLNRIYSVNDLGVLLDRKLKFASHITFTVNKAMSVLGFIKRWCSQCQVHIDRIESVQKKCFFFALHGLN